MMNEPVVINERSIKVFESRKFQMGHEFKVEKLQRHAAALYELLSDIPIEPGNTETGRLVSLAKTELESCVMWAVKAYSRQQQSVNVEAPKT